MNLDRREFLASATLWSAVAGRAAEGPLNVIFMVADDMNNALGCYGNRIVKTPHLDKLAARGTRFDRAYCQFPLCAPTRASFLSGRRPETTKVLSLHIPTRQYMQDVVMLPELFRKNGRFTAQLGKVYHTGPQNVDPRSWDFMLEENGKNPPTSEMLEWHEAKKPRNHSMLWGKLKTPEEETPDGIVAHKAQEMMRKRHAEGKPFFLGVGFRRPHSPYTVPRKYFDLYDPAKIPLPQAGNPDAILPAAWYELANQQRLTEKETREYIAAYYACNSFVDAQVGRVLSTLDELNLWDRTAIVFVGDHGYHNGEHAMWHKMTLFEESCRVPLLMYAPGMSGAGKPCRGLVELVDLYPTLVELAGLKAPAGLEGTSLVPQLRDPSLPARKAAYTMVGRSEDRKVSHTAPTYFGHTVRTDGWRYTEWDGGRRGVELYDEQNDPREMKNLAEDPKHAAARKELKKLLQRESS